MTAPTKLFELGMDALVEMYQIDATSLGDTIYYFTPHDLYGQDITWDSQIYTKFPIVASGFERKANGTLPRPTLILSNYNGLISALCMVLGDLIGAKVTRIRTLKKYLDAVNFGGVNPTANPNVEFPREVWRIDRRQAETADSVSFELAAPWDVAGVRIPRRIVVQNSCTWGYRSAECGYVGGAVAQADDTPTSNILLDKCGKRVPSCKLRFGASAELPFGGYPSVGQTTGHI